MIRRIMIVAALGLQALPAFAAGEAVDPAFAMDNFGIEPSHGLLPSPALLRTQQALAVQSKLDEAVDTASAVAETMTQVQEAAESVAQECAQAPPTIPAAAPATAAPPASAEIDEPAGTSSYNTSLYDWK